MYAELVVSNNTDQTDQLYTYKTGTLEVAIGDQVFIPFGRGKGLTQGYVFNVSKETTIPNNKLKAIEAIAEKGVLSSQQIKLCLWMRKNYLCRYIEAIQCFVPNFSQNGQPKMQTYYSVNEATQLERVSEILKRAPKQKELLELLLEVGMLSRKELLNEYGFTPSHIKGLKERGFIEEKAEAFFRTPNSSMDETHKTPHLLTQEQEKIVTHIKEQGMNQKDNTILIQGVTGSGKTELYMHLIHEVLKSGKNALVLVPEIALTIQTIQRFRGRFGRQHIAVVHSKLSEGERYDEWHRIKTKGVRVVIGVRSALFAPLKNIGIIVIDEAHEGTYKSEIAPRYDAIDLARKMGQLNHALVVLGSATPSLISNYRAEAGLYKKYVLKERYNQVPLPKTEIVDMAEELKRGNKTIFSLTLYEKITQALKENKQVILFLNRRGYATFVSCRSCGYVAKCPTCDISLTYHQGRDHLSCHFCGYEMVPPKNCPDCNSRHIKYFGLGTEKVEEIAREIFPQARVGRLDIDSTRKKGAMEKTLEKFEKGEINLLVGTQLVAKGLDFKEVAVVGILAADMSLNIPDYRSKERTFQLITQVAGRSGRGTTQGNVVIQTYTPHHFAITTASNHDYDAFYKEEIENRKHLIYPPFSNIIYIVVSDKNKALAWNSMVAFARDLKEMKKTIEGIYILGPQVAPISKINDFHRYQIIMKVDAKSYKKVLETLERMKHKKTNGHYGKSRISIDFNPFSFM